MSTPLRLALAQLNQVVGDIAGNERRIDDAIEAARARGAQLVVTPELALTGYPPEDLLLKEHFLRDGAAALGRVAERTHGIVALVGFPERAAEGVYNACAVVADGRVQAIYRKVHLPNYGVFDEQRYFRAAPVGGIVELDGALIGLSICEDIWLPGPPASDEALAGATLIVNVSASPYQAGKGIERERMLAQRARELTSVVAFCALVGGQDELVFDGHSLVIDHDGAVVARAPQFAEHLLIADIDVDEPRARRLGNPLRRPLARRGAPAIPVLARLSCPPSPASPSPGPAELAPLLDREAEVYAALVLGLRDYVEKNGFAHAVLGLSGGVDSALVACLAVDALGPARVSVAIMPSPHSSGETQGDARALADALGVERLDFDISAAMAAYDGVLAEAFEGREPDLTEENLQARIRGNLLMALSNKFGWIVLTTGNKSEMSVGYSTLYGDSAGGFAVIKDVPKTLVYALVRHRNARGDGGAEVAASILERAPSAELRPGQQDDDTLLPYERLDPILALYVEQELGREEIVRRGYDAAEVDTVLRLVDRAEYKRRQNPPGIKISQRAFGRDRRVPITNRYGG